MTVATRICAGPGCSEPLTSAHGNAIYHSPLCRNRYNKMVRRGEIALHCPRCGHRDYVMTLAGDDGCLRCAYAVGDTLSMDGIRIIEGKYERVL